MAGLDIKLAVSSGIPEAFAAALNYAAKVRDTMDSSILREFDEINLNLSKWFWYDVIGLPKSDPK